MYCLPVQLDLRSLVLRQPKELNSHMFKKQLIERCGIPGDTTLGLPAAQWDMQQRAIEAI